MFKELSSHVPLKDLFLCVIVNEHLYFLSSMCQENPEPVLKACYCHIGAWVSLLRG